MNPPTTSMVEIHITNEGSTALIRYNRPLSGNSLHPRMLQEMVEVLQWVDNHPTVRIVVQTGAGNFYCTGMELLEVEDSGMSFAKGSDFHEMNRLLISSSKVLIAAVNGPAVGYGMSSLALYDLVYSLPDAYFFTPFVRWGMAPEGGSSFTFPILMGHQQASLLCLANERIDAQTALRLGLVSKILEGEGFLDSVVQIAGRISKEPPESLKATKNLLRQSTRQQLLEANDRECNELHTRRYGYPEFQTSILQFRERQAEKGKRRRAHKSVL